MTIDNVLSEIENIEDTRQRRCSLISFYAANKDELYQEEDYCGLKKLGNVMEEYSLKGPANNCKQMAGEIAENNRQIKFYENLEKAMDRPFVGDYLAQSEAQIADQIGLGEKEMALANRVEFNSYLDQFEYRKKHGAATDELGLYAERALDCAQKNNLGDGAIKRAEQYMNSIKN